MTLGRIFDELPSCWHFADIRKKTLWHFVFSANSSYRISNISWHSISQTNPIKIQIRKSLRAFYRSILMCFQASLVHLSSLKFPASALKGVSVGVITILSEETAPHLGPGSSSPVRAEQDSLFSTQMVRDRWRF